MRLTRLLLAALILLGGCAPTGSADQGIRADRIVVVGDIHGDYDNFVEILREVRLTDPMDSWIGGTDQLVQLGDAPDRGPDTLKIIRFLKALSEQAAEAGGQVHALIGNHESMNMQGDLRYVHPGEYQAFVDSESKARRDRFFAMTVEQIKWSKPQRKWPEFDAAYRADWDTQYPLGYLEHRAAWAPTGELGQWVLGNSAVVMLNTTLFLHGGLNIKAPFKPVSEINTRVRTELAAPDNLSDRALVNRADGPLWYRGLATMAETKKNQTAVERMLAFYGAERMVVGHTPILGTLLPRFNGRVVLADVGLSDHYGGAIAALVLEDGSAWLYQKGQRIELPTSVDERMQYLLKVKPLVPRPQRIDGYLKTLATSGAIKTTTDKASEARQP